MVLPTRQTRPAQTGVQAAPGLSTHRHTSGRVRLYPGSSPAPALGSRCKPPQVLTLGHSTLTASRGIKSHRKQSGEVQDGPRSAAQPLELGWHLLWKRGHPELQGGLYSQPRASENILRQGTGRGPYGPPLGHLR